MLIEVWFMWASLGMSLLLLNLTGLLILSRSFREELSALATIEDLATHAVFAPLWTLKLLLQYVLSPIGQGLITFILIGGLGAVGAASLIFGAIAFLCSPKFRAWLRESSTLSEIRWSAKRSIGRLGRKGH